jgi:hypothetical protein
VKNTFWFIVSVLISLPTASFAATYHCDDDCKSIIARSQEVLTSLLADPDRIVGIEMILATPSEYKLYEHWGHIQMRFVIAGEDAADNPVLEFDGNTTAESVNLVKGFYGGYAGIPVFESVKDFWLEYITGEDRDLVRSIIPTSPAMRLKILQTLQNWLSNPSKNIGNYNFPNNNCAGIMTRFLQDAGFPFSGIRARLPDHVPRYLSRLLLNPYSPLVVNVPDSLINQTAKTLGLSTADFVTGKNWPSDAAQKLVDSSSSMQALAWTESALIPADAQKAFKNALGDPENRDLNEVLGFAEVPAPMYGVCATQTCVANLIPIEKQLWSEAELQNAKKERAEAANRTLKRPHESVLDATEVVQHFKLLLDADSAQ